jgi:hypothetical protein
MSFQFDSTRLKKRIAGTLEKIYTQADPALLNQYRSIFKKEVSFFRRSYFAAYLLMELDRGKEGKITNFREKNFHKYKRTDKAAAGFSQDGETGSRSESHKLLPEEDSVQLFISAGRSRRVFPREILGLILSKTSVSKDDIGAIRILDNYSFVQVKTAAADEIIEALNGRSFRGRSLAVNYARNRKEEAPSDIPEENTPDGMFSGTVSSEAADDDYGDYGKDTILEEAESELVQEDDDHSDKENV